MNQIPRLYPECSIHEGTDSCVNDISTIPNCHAKHTMRRELVFTPFLFKHDIITYDEPVNVPYSTESYRVEQYGTCLYGDRHVPHGQLRTRGCMTHSEAIDILCD